MKTNKSNFIHCFTALLIVILLLTSFMAVGYSAISQKSAANATSPNIYYFSDCGESYNCIDTANSWFELYPFSYYSFTDETEFHYLYQTGYYYDKVEDCDYVIFESRYHSFERHLGDLADLFGDWDMMGVKIMFIYGFAPSMMLYDYLLNFVDIFITTDVFTQRFFSFVTKIEEEQLAYISTGDLSGSTWIINEGVELMPYNRYDSDIGYCRWLSFSQDFFRPFLLETCGQYITGSESLQSILMQLDIELYIYKDNDYFYDAKYDTYVNNINITNRNLFTFWSTYDRPYGAQYPILNIDFMYNEYVSLAASADNVLSICSYMYNDFYCDPNTPIYKNGITLPEFDRDIADMVFSLLRNEPLVSYDNIPSRCDVTHLMTRFGGSYDAASLPLTIYDGSWNFWNIGSWNYSEKEFLF